MPPNLEDPDQLDGCTVAKKYLAEYRRRIRKQEIDAEPWAEDLAYLRDLSLLVSGDRVPESEP